MTILVLTDMLTHENQLHHRKVILDYGPLLGELERLNFRTSPIYKYFLYAVKKSEYVRTHIWSTLRCS